MGCGLGSRIRWNRCWGHLLLLDRGGDGLCSTALVDGPTLMRSGAAEEGIDDVGSAS